MVCEMDDYFIKPDNDLPPREIVEPVAAGVAWTTNKDQNPMADLAPVFLLGIRDAVATMQGAGLNWAQIGCIVQDIRSQTLNEEFQRLKRLVEDNPPHHHTWAQTGKAINHER